MALDIVLSNISGEPLYEQIKQQLKTAVLRGDLSEGDALPSIRGLARDLRVSVITTTRAYADLAAEGFITNVPGKGSYVLPRDSELVREQLLREIEADLLNGLRKAQLAGLPPNELRKIIDALIEQEL